MKSDTDHSRIILYITIYSSVIALAASSPQLNMVDWSSPTEIAQDAREFVSLSYANLTNVAQSPSIGSFTVFLGCICAYNI